MMAVSEERLSEINVEFSDEAACCVIMASKGYPEKYQNGFEIVIPKEIEELVYVAGAKYENEKLYSAGGRVLGVVDVNDTLKMAINGAYEKVEKIKFDNAFYRHDIGQRALKATEEK